MSTVFDIRDRLELLVAGAVESVTELERDASTWMRAEAQMNAQEGLLSDAYAHIQELEAAVLGHGGVMAEELERDNEWVAEQVALGAKYIPWENVTALGNVELDVVKAHVKAKATHGLFEQALAYGMADRKAGAVSTPYHEQLLGWEVLCVELLNALPEKKDATMARLIAQEEGWKAEIEQEKAAAAGILQGIERQVKRQKALEDKHGPQLMLLVNKKMTERIAREELARSRKATGKRRPIRTATTVADQTGARSAGPVPMQKPGGKAKAGTPMGVFVESIKQVMREQGVEPRNYKISVTRKGTSVNISGPELPLWNLRVGPSALDTLKSKLIEVGL